MIALVDRLCRIWRTRRLPEQKAVLKVEESSKSGFEL